MHGIRVKQHLRPMVCLILFIGPLRWSGMAHLR
jgi:hypothetical protein